MTLRNSRCCNLGCASGVMDGGSELEVGGPSSGSSRIRCIHLRANNIGRGVGSLLLLTAMG